MRFNSHWNRARLGFSSQTARVGLMLVSIVAMVVGGTAGDHWF